MVWFQEALFSSTLYPLNSFFEGLQLWLMYQVRIVATFPYIKNGIH